MPRKAVAIAVGAITTMVISLFAAAPAGAVLSPGPAPVSSTRSGANTDLVLSNTGYGEGVSGWISPEGWTVDLTMYPTSIPSDFTAKDEPFAGVIIGSPTDGVSPDVEMYCINIRTETYIGTGYQLDTWSDANVANVGYVAQLLNDYYPNTDEPSTLASDPNARAAAVQAAIWYFSDGYVLDPSDPLYSDVAGIVNTVLAEGPLVEPPPPSLTVTPSTLSAPEGQRVGPFTVTSGTDTAEVSATGADMFDAATGGSQITNNTSVPTKTQIWLQSTGGSSAVLTARAEDTVPSGNVYLYSGTAGPDAYQKLILAQEATLTSDASATAEFLSPGSLTVTKTIAGPAAGDPGQGTVTIYVYCNGSLDSLTPFVIPAESPAGDYSYTWSGIPAGSICVVREIVGTSGNVIVDPEGGQQVTIESGVTVTAQLTDTYSFFPGSLTVTKSIAGPAAGQQGTVIIQVFCNGHNMPPLKPIFVIPAESPAGDYPYTYTDIPAGSICTVNESTSISGNVTVDQEGNGQQVTIESGVTATAQLTDTYGFAPGHLTVTKTNTGTPGGPITITTTCTGPEEGVTTPPLSPLINIPPGPDTQTYEVPGNSLCTAVEDPDGSSDVVSVERGGDPQEYVPANGTGSIDLTNTYTSGLTVNKTIQGAAAGKQGQIVIDVSCTNAGAPVAINTSTITIPANTPAGTVSTVEGPISSGSSCTATETTNGSTSTVDVSPSGSQTATVTVPAGGDAATINFTNTYSFVPASLVVTKTIAGSAAGKQGAVIIQATCIDPNGNAADPDPNSFTVPAGSAAGDYPNTFTVPAGSVCTVAETENGSTSTVAVAPPNSPQTIPVPVTGATAGITDTYTPAPGSLLVLKSLSGDAVGQQGEITIDVTCGTTALAPFVIPAGQGAGIVAHSYDGLAAGSVCTVNETEDGSTSSVVAAVTGNGQQATIASGSVAAAELIDVYTDGPGSLLVTKTLAGPAAGQQGPVSILATCGGSESFAINIPAGTSAGPLAEEFPGIPAGSTCTVEEIDPGGTTTVAVQAVGSGQTATVPAGGTASVALTDTFTAVTAATTALAFTGTAARFLFGLAGVTIAVGIVAVIGARPGRWRRRRGRDRS